MKRAPGVALLAALALLGAVVAAVVQGVAAQESTTAARSSGVDVIMMRCATGGQNLTVLAYQGSTGAPGRRADNCPQAVSELLKEGFTIRHVGYSVDADFLVTTLVR